MRGTAEASERRLAEDYETLLEIGVQLAGTLDLQGVLELALRRAEELCRAESSSIWELDDDSGELFFRVVRGRAAGAIRALRVPLGQGIVGSVAKNARRNLVTSRRRRAWRGDSGINHSRPADGAADRRGRGVAAAWSTQGPQVFLGGRPAPHAPVAGPLANAMENAPSTLTKAPFVGGRDRARRGDREREPYTAPRPTVSPVKPTAGPEIGVSREASRNCGGLTLHMSEDRRARTIS